MTHNISEKYKAGFLDKVWSDDAYRARLQKNPKAALTEIGGHVPDDVNIRCVMDTGKVKYLHIPAAPAEGEVFERDLMDVQGGTTVSCLSAFTAIIGTLGVGVVTISATQGN